MRNKKTVITRGTSETNSSEYQYRNLPCTDKAYCVAGHDAARNCSGILEWCYDLADAQDRLNRMKQHNRFEGLFIDYSPESVLESIPYYE
jgi:hypothetical protein